MHQSVKWIMVGLLISCTLRTAYGEDSEDNSSLATDIFIESPKLTNWGEWGNVDLCPVGTYASGMALKVEPYLGDNKADDDTSLNGIRLLCIPPGSNNFSEAVSITSSINEWGSWGKSYFCDQGVITGFQLRSEPNLGSRKDNTGANNLRIFCSNLQGGFLEGDGHTWGQWTEPQMCLSQQAVCGIKTQSQAYIGDKDDTALNNIMMKCCTIPNIGKTCNPSDEWETIFECDNTRSTEPLECTYEKARGITKSSTSSEAQLEEYNLFTSLGFSTSAMYNGLSANFRYNLNTSHNTGYNWATDSSETFHEATRTTAQFVVPGGTRSRLSQAVGTCGFFDVFTNYFMKEDFNCDEQSIKSYFHD